MPFYREGKFIWEIQYLVSDALDQREPLLRQIEEESDMIDFFNSSSSEGEQIEG
jgi:hypothetical protein